jgi:hypothetical protein
MFSPLGFNKRIKQLILLVVELIKLTTNYIQSANLEKYISRERSRCDVKKQAESSKQQRHKTNNHKNFL